MLPARRHPRCATGLRRRAPLPGPDRQSPAGCGERLCRAGRREGHVGVVPPLEWRHTGCQGVSCRVRCIKCCYNLHCTRSLLPAPEHTPIGIPGKDARAAPITVFILYVVCPDRARKHKQALTRDKYAICHNPPHRTRTPPYLSGWAETSKRPCGYPDLLPRLQVPHMGLWPLPWP